MPIVPLPQFEEDLKAYLSERADREAYERLNAPTTIVVRFGAMRMVGEFPYSGDAKPGCGSKMVVRTHRGEELGEMLTSTCPNAGCSKSVTRREMLEYIENSGGKDYPFFDAHLKGGGPNASGIKGRVLRIATKADIDRQAAIDSNRQPLVRRARAEAEAVGFQAKICEAEEVLGGGHVTYFYLAEQRTDHGAILSRLRSLHPDARVEMRQVGARDEARLTADYERCGQHCCCKGFLKVLKPVSMRSAKVQKATLDPLKISGRCGRLMCCLRYEDQTYKDLKKNLPHRKTRVGTPHGDGIVVDSQILTQLVLVELDSRERVAVPVEELAEPGQARAPEAPAPPSREKPAKGRRRDAPTESDTIKQPGPSEDKPATKGKRRRKRKKPAAGGSAETANDGTQTDAKADAQAGAQADAPKAVGRRRPKKPEGDTPSADEGVASARSPDGEQQQAKKRRRRRRRNLGGSQNPDGRGGPTDGGGPSGSGDGSG
ncbi:MAG: regulatory iron-sulfur-containing complex subunit RicT [Planctomycetota bacterium]